MSEPKELPVIILTWDAAEQQVGFRFDEKQFKTWDFVLAIMGMAVASIQDAKKAAQMVAMQQKMMQQARDAQIAQMMGNKERVIH